MKEKKVRMAVIGSIAGLIGLGGFLLIARAGDLEPSDPPGSTMYTLEEIYNRPVWRILDKSFVDWAGNSRYAVCDNGTAGDLTDDMVHDKETGLIWPRDADIFGTDKEWQDAITSCHNLTLGDRKGWRLATVEEISSLFDMSQGNPVLPSGHPFINVQSGYWSSTTYEFNTARAYSVSTVSGWVSNSPKTSWPNIWAWPVRGGNGYAIRN